MLRFGRNFSRLLRPSLSGRVKLTVVLCALMLPGCNSVSTQLTPSKALASWYRGGLAGKKIVYWGNSTVSNAYQMFIDLGQETRDGGALQGLEYRWDIQGVATGDGSVTVTLSSPVEYKVGQWVSIRFSNAVHTDTFGLPSAQIVSVQGNSFTYLYPHVAASEFEADNGQVTGSILNFGNNGASLAAMLHPNAPYSAQLVCEQKPDLLIVRGPLINDVRLGTTNLAEATQLERTALDMFHACIPNAAILLTTENSLLTTDTGEHWVQPNADAQSYTNIMHDAVMAMNGIYPNVDVVDVMAEVYGTTSPSTSPYMANQLHPGAAGQNVEAQLLLKIIGTT